uniref:Targeting protein for Xklp2 homolog n=1 Tax=Patiria pectinifera TaxID=7594 RepID=TPX2_PATPE|nr:RecName: Full=Targeting protein for Xklp2 homolog; Short=TPX2 homolog; AltName: Full=Microtubule-associated protein TPX2 homolog [Patiria pectinifera]BAJ24842.1 microtubule-associated protein homolog-like [Patiria pectinifera]
MADVEMMEYVDDVYEMDCPKFVDFSVPQVVDDNADEWFNFDHENGVPLTFDDKAVSPTAKETPTSPLPQDPQESHSVIGHSETDTTLQESSAPEIATSEKQKYASPSDDVSSAESETCEMSTDSMQDKPAVPESAVRNVTDDEATVQESSDAEETQTLPSSCVDSSTAEMSTDSLEDKPQKPQMQESPKPRKRYGNLVTSFARRDEDTTTASSDHSEPEQKKPRSRQRSVEVVSRPTRKSPRLHSRRSAEPTRLKRPSITSQAVKRRSANSALGHPRSRVLSTDQPISKRRKIGSEITPAGRPDAKKSCPKLKAKINLTMPTTPTLLKRNLAKPNTQLKTTEQMELDRIAQFQHKLAAIRKKSALSYKAVKESVPVAPVHAAVQPTRPEEFKFETDARLKSHTMETRKDTKNKDFVGNLRKYVPSPSKPQGITKPRPFNFSDNRKRTHEESFSGEKKGYEFKATALAVSQFHTKTPDRFRSKPLSEQNKGPEPAHDRPKKAKLTQPMTPALESRNRHRPVTAISQAQREEQELADMKNYKFKARPVDPRVMSNIAVGVKTVHHKEPTKPIGFDLEIEKRLLERETNKVQTEERYEFRARPLPAKILAGPVGIAEAKAAAVTIPKSPAFALKERVKVYKEKEREKEKDSEHDNSHIIKARPILHAGVPFMPNIQHKRTEPEPFSFDEKIQESKARKEAKIQETLREEERARQFRAQPLPDLTWCSGVPDKKVKPPTQMAPFSVAEKGAKQAEEWSKKMEEEIRDCKRMANAFKAKPANILYEEPFVPEKSTKPMTDISNFSLNTERRAEDRKGYEQAKYERQLAQDTAQAQREAEKEEELRQQISKQRADSIHKAKPVRHYKAVEVLPSTKPLTQPKTPKFSDRTRRSSHTS